MESALRPERRVDSEKARRIVAAMRSSVGSRGATASTFDQVAQEAGVSRGLLHELFSVSRGNAEIREELAELYRRLRAQVAAILGAKQADGVVRLRGEPEAVASLLFALGDGLELQLVSDPDWDSSRTFAAGIETARFLLGAE